MLPVLTALSVASTPLLAASYTAEGVASTDMQNQQQARSEALKRALE